MPIEQEFRIDKKHRRAFRDICTSLLFYIITLGSSVFGLFMAYVAEHPIISLGCCLASLAPCIFAIVDLIRIARIGMKKSVFRYSFNETEAVRYTQDGKKTVFPYLTMTVVQESESFLKLASKKYAAILKKDELTPETLNEACAAIKAANPKIRWQNVRGRNLTCTILTAIITAAVLVYSMFCVLPIADGFASAPPPDVAAVKHYTETYSIGTEGCWSSQKYESKDGREALLYVGNDLHADCPTELYYLSFSNRDWHIRGLSASEILLEFQTDTARVRVIQIDTYTLLEVRCAEDLECRTEALYPQRWWVIQDCKDGVFDKIKTRECPNGIQEDSVLYLGDEAYPIGEMLAEEQQR